MPYESMMAKHPTRVVEHAVKGMLPHNRLGRQMFRRLKVYEGAEHPHESQVADSLNALEKDREEGVVWLGLPKPQYKKRLRKAKESSEAPAPAIEEAPADAVTPEEPTAEAEPVTSDAEPVVEAEDSVEEAEPTAEMADEVVDSEPVAEVEAAEASETEPTEEDKERGA